MDNCGPEMIYGALQHGLTNIDFKKALHIKPPKSVYDLMTRAERYIRAEEEMAPIRQQSQAEPAPARQREESSPKSKKKQRLDRSPPRSGRQYSRYDKRAPRFEDFTKLNSSRVVVMMYAKDAGHLRTPAPMRTLSGRRDSKKYCRYHKDIDHDTEDCYQLKNDIEELIKKGHLRKYVDTQKAPRDSDAEEKCPDRGSDRPTSGIRVIEVISGGSASGGSSSSQRKKYAWSVTFAIDTPMREAESISFTDDDLAKVQFPHDDAGRHWQFVRYPLCVCIPEDGTRALRLEILFRSNYRLHRIPGSDIRCH